MPEGSDRIRCLQPDVGSVPAVFETWSSLKCDTVRSGWTCPECGIEIQIKVRIDHQVAWRDPSDVHLMISFGVDLAEIVLVQEVVRYYQSLLIFGESDIVRTGRRSQI